MTTPQDLEQLLLLAATRPQDELATAALTGALLDAEVLVLGGVGLSGGFRPLLLSGPDGPVAAFFSSPERAELARIEHEADGPFNAQVIGCRAFWQMATRNGTSCVLNPYSPDGRTFTVAELFALLTGAA